MIRNFLFHRVSPKRDPLWDPMDVSLFERCIKYISSRYKVYLFEGLANDQKIIRQDNIATIMFDDGYKDNIEFAIPILEKYNVKASFYVVTECIHKNIPTWTYSLDHSFQSTHQPGIELDFDFLPEKIRKTTFKDGAHRIQFARDLKPILKTISHSQRDLVLSNISHYFSDVELPKIMMNWDDLNTLTKSGHYVGSHTVSHCMLGTMTDKNEIRKELTISGNIIRKELGYFPMTISYPVGSYNQEIKEICKEVGYKIGLAVNQKIYNPDNTDLFEVPRIELYNEHWWKTKLRITNQLEEIKKLIGY